MGCRSPRRGNILLTLLWLLLSGCCLQAQLASESLQLESMLSCQRGEEYLQKQRAGRSQPPQEAEAEAVIWSCLAWEVCGESWEEEDAGVQAEESWLAAGFSAWSSIAVKAFCCQLLARAGGEKGRQLAADWLRRLRLEDWRQTLATLSCEERQWLLEAVWLSGKAGGWQRQEAEELEQAVERLEGAGESLPHLYRFAVRSRIPEGSWEGLLPRLARCQGAEELYWLCRIFWAREQAGERFLGDWRGCAVGRLLARQLGDGSWPVSGTSAEEGGSVKGTALALLAFDYCLGHEAGR